MTSSPDLIHELRASRPSAPLELRARVREIAAAQPKPRPLRGRAGASRSGAACSSPCRRPLRSRSRAPACWGSRARMRRQHVGRQRDTTEVVSTARATAIDTAEAGSCTDQASRQPATPRPIAHSASAPRSRSRSRTPTRSRAPRRTPSTSRARSAASSSPRRSRPARRGARRSPSASPSARCRTRSRASRGSGASSRSR